MAEQEIVKHSEKAVKALRKKRHIEKFLLSAPTFSKKQIENSYLEMQDVDLTKLVKISE